MTSAWTTDHAERIDNSKTPSVPKIDHADRSDLRDNLVYWDMWPIQDRTGHIALIKGRELWMALCAPDRSDPSIRHFEAKIRLIERADGRWIDIGDLLPEFRVDYEREWAGSALYDGGKVSLFFTAAGTDEKPGGYQQRLFETHASIGADGLPCDWTQPVPAIAADHPAYMLANAHEGEAGKIKAFRDPAYFCDPADGQEYLIFTASLADAASDFNGAIGIARRKADSAENSAENAKNSAAQWELLEPLIHADGVNNELERAHAVYHDGRYYVFWVTQSFTFAPGLNSAPNGLYGMVADSLFGQYRPLNGSGLVLGNPPQEPLQAYSWFVSSELLVSSFVDFYALNGAPVPQDPASANARFGGVPAPLLKLHISGDNCTLEQPAFA